MVSAAFVYTIGLVVFQVVTAPKTVKEYAGFWIKLGNDTSTFSWAYFAYKVVGFAIGIVLAVIIIVYGAGVAMSSVIFSGLIFVVLSMKTLYGMKTCIKVPVEKCESFVTQFEGIVGDADLKWGESFDDFIRRVSLETSYDMKEVTSLAEKDDAEAPHLDPTAAGVSPKAETRDVVNVGMPK